MKNVLRWDTHPRESTKNGRLLLRGVNVFHTRDHKKGVRGQIELAPISRTGKLSRNLELTIGIAASDWFDAMFKSWLIFPTGAVERLTRQPRRTIRHYSVTA